VVDRSAACVECPVISASHHRRLSDYLQTTTHTTHQTPNPSPVLPPGVSVCAVCPMTAALAAQHTWTHTYTHPFNGPLSGTTRVSRYQQRQITEGTALKAQVSKYVRVFVQRTIMKSHNALVNKLDSNYEPTGTRLIINYLYW